MLLTANQKVLLLMIRSNAFQSLISPQNIFPVQYMMYSVAETLGLYRGA